MTVAFEGGYALPGGDLPLKHARVLHEGNRLRVKTMSASSELANYPASAANIGSTVDRWRPFQNLFTNPTDFSGSDWTKSNLTVGADGQTLDDGVAASVSHSLVQSVTVETTNYVFWAKVQMQTGHGFRLSVTQGSVPLIDFDITDGAVPTVTPANGALGDYFALGNDIYLVRAVVPTTAAAVQMQFRMRQDDAVTYTGANNTIKLLEMGIHKAEATLQLDTFAAQEGDVMAIAAHNLGSGSGRVAFEHDSDENDIWTSIGTVTPTDDSPIMFIFVPITSNRWRITVDRGVLPEIGVFRVGKALQMERPFYGSFSPTRMNRATEILGNLSGTGELLGRSKRRTILQAKYSWDNLTDAWVRANLDTPTGLIQSVEVEPLFLTWRPADRQDVDYMMRCSTDVPSPNGQRDLYSFSLTGEVHSYE